jgi:Prealbumin-like fold domain
MAYVAICILGALILLLSSMISNIYGILNEWKIKVVSLVLDSNLTYNNKQFNNLPINSKNISLLNNNNNDNISKSDAIGLLNVITTVDNKNIGNKSPSDFTITVHANDPYPSSFSGNPLGTKVKLGMGMYSISEFILPGYFASFSNDCFGGIMSPIVKNCTIKNTYTAISNESKSKLQY